MLAKGSDLVNNKKFEDAIEIFSIKLDPSWAEAWNKRATALYLIGQKSQNDILDGMINLAQGGKNMSWISFEVVM